MNRNALKGLLVEKLVAHDWYYMYADDQRAWEKGNKEAKDISALVDDLGADGRAIYKQYSKE